MWILILIGFSGVWHWPVAFHSIPGFISKQNCDQAGAAFSGKFINENYATFVCLEQKK